MSAAGRSSGPPTPRPPTLQTCGAAAHLFVADVAAAAPELAADDLDHLRRSLRLRPGELVSIADGAGAWRLARWSGRGLVAEGDVNQERAAPPPITVGVPLVKGDRTDWAVQKLTEVGVDRILLLCCRRSVVRWPLERVEGNMERLRRIARAAAMQARRSRLPELVAPAEVQDHAAGAAIAQMGGAPPSLEWPILLVGPEGGWDPEELSLGARLVGLGPGVMRSETAAVVAGALLVALRAGVVANAANNA